MPTSFHLRVHEKLKEYFEGFFNLEVSLGFTIYLSAILITLTTASSYFLIYRFQHKQALISNEILDLRIGSMEAARTIKESVVGYDNMIFRYVATKSGYDWERAQELRKKALLELGRLYVLTANPTITSLLADLRPRLIDYFEEAGKLVQIARSNNLPTSAGLFQAASWARSQGTQRQELSVLSAEGVARLERVFALCDEILTYNRAQLSSARIDIEKSLQESQRLGKLIVGLSVGFVLLVAFGLAISLLGPLRTLMRGVRQIESGQLDVELPVTNSTEIGKLTMAFNRMARTIREQRERLLQETITDDLTGAYNQRHFNKRLEQEFERSKRADEPLSLMMIDVDRFKDYNDALGHEMGNVVLRRIAMIIHENLRDMDLLFRYGGDEFAVILPNADPVESRMIAGRITQVIRSARFPGEERNENSRVTLSLGGATYPHNSLSLQDLVIKADEAMYTAKSAGRDGVRWSEILTPVS